MRPLPKESDEALQRRATPWIALQTVHEKCTSHNDYTKTREDGYKLKASGMSCTAKSACHTKQSIRTNCLRYTVGEHVLMTAALQEISTKIR